jgi:hypothetical protein
VGHKVKIHKITSATGKERGDIEIRDYVVLQKPQEQDNLLPPSRTLILDFTMTHKRYGRSIQHTTGQFTHTRRSDGVPELDGSLQKVRSDGVPELDGSLQKVTRDKIRHYRQIYLDKPDPISFIPFETSSSTFNSFPCSLSPIGSQ